MSEKPRVRGVVFDKDGTLFDFQATWGVWTRGLIEAESGGDPGLAARLAERMGYDMGAGRFLPGSVVVASTTEQVAERILPLLPGVAKADLMARMNAAAAEAPQVEAAPLREVLGRLREMGLALGVATNDSEAPARAHLRAAGVEADFAFVAGYDSGWGGKPEAGQLHAFAAAVGLAPESCLMVGDSLHDLHAARAAGMPAVAVLTGVAGAEELAPAAEAVLPTIADLPDWLRARAG